DLGLELGCGPLELGRHRLAWPAPWRPEVDDDGDVVGSDVALERAGVQRDGVAVEEPLFAFPARRPVTEPLSLHTVCRAAMRTADVGEFVRCFGGHKLPCTLGFRPMISREPAWPDLE